MRCIVCWGLFSRVRRVWELNCFLPILALNPSPDTFCDVICYIWGIFFSVFVWKKSTNSTTLQVVGRFDEWDTCGKTCWDGWDVRNKRLFKRLRMVSSDLVKNVWLPSGDVQASIKHAQLSSFPLIWIEQQTDNLLGGGFKYILWSPLLGDDSHFD